ncbi:CotH kinase family protein [Mucilaginibacter hurinus]|nr:CotH kinase family protein [Mucilaginibacter hurinus]
MLKRHFTLLFIITAIWSCKKEGLKESANNGNSGLLAVNALPVVKIEASKNPGIVSTDVYATFSGSEVNALIPGINNNKKLVITFTTAGTGATVRVNDTLQVSGVTRTDFTKPVIYTVTLPGGKVYKYKFTVKNFTGIPVFYITTSGPVVSKDDYVTGSLVINTNTLFTQEKNNIPLQIKGRGNSTWGMPKKPYRLKFDSKAAVLGMPSAKNWVLLANYSDKTLLRTSLAFNLGGKLGANFTPQGRHVELVMNGEHLGSYLLTSQVEVHENRVNIPELKAGDVSPDKITGGYLLELDQRLDEDFWFRTSIKNVPFTIKSPEDIPQAQFDYIKDYMQQTENAIYASNFADPVNGYAKYINVESFINWYIVQELMKNQDAKDFSSVYYYKDRDGKLCMGPLWDFDLAAGNVNYSDATHPTGWWIKDGPWFSRLFEDVNFRKKVKARWNQVKNKEIRAMGPFIDSTVNHINLSQKENFKKWPILNQYVWPNPVVLGTYEKEVAHVKSWLTKRAHWLDSEFIKM